MNTVQIKNLTKTFDSTLAIDNLSLDIEKGKITGLIGADGAGKTTLIRLVIGLLVPDNGEVSVLGLNPFTQKEQLNKLIGYMPQKFGLYEDLTILENLRLYADLKNQPYDFDKLLEQMQPFSKIRNRVFLSRSRKRVWELTEEDCNDAQTFEYRGHAIWNGF